MTVQEIEDGSGRLVVPDMAHWLTRNLFIIFVIISFLSAVFRGDDNVDVDDSGKSGKKSSVIRCIVVLGFESHLGDGNFCFTRHVLYFRNITLCQN